SIEAQHRHPSAPALLSALLAGLDHLDDGDVLGESAAGAETQIDGPFGRPRIGAVEERGVEATAMGTSSSLSSLTPVRPIVPLRDGTDPSEPGPAPLLPEAMAIEVQPLARVPWAAAAMIALGLAVMLLAARWAAERFTLPDEVQVIDSPAKSVETR